MICRKLSFTVCYRSVVHGREKMSTIMAYPEDGLHNTHTYSAVDGTHSRSLTHKKRLQRSDHRRFEKASCAPKCRPSRSSHDSRFLDTVNNFFPTWCTIMHPGRSWQSTASSIWLPKSSNVLRVKYKCSFVSQSACILLPRSSHTPSSRDLSQ